MNGSLPATDMTASVNENGSKAPAIEVRGLTKAYRLQHEGLVQALDRVSFSVEEGEFICLAGPSGCGKSTLLKILAGIVPYSTGEIAIQGQSPEMATSRFGLVFQSPVLLPWRNVLQNTMLPAEVFNLDRGQAERHARELLAMVGLSGFESSYPAELSGGMQQRCAITRALLHDPSILFMDEPFGALDALTRDTMNLELQRIWHESRKTVFLITHSISEAVFLADRVLVMSARPGRIVDDIRIALPRPRSLDVMTTTAFGEAVGRIRSQLGLDARGPDRVH